MTTKTPDTRLLSYGEQNGYPWIDWDRWLGDALLGLVSTENERVAVLNADDHSTDALAMSGYRVPRLETGQPQDTYLAGLGMAFYERIRDRRWADAIVCFRQIESYLEAAGFPKYNENTTTP